MSVSTNEKVGTVVVNLASPAPVAATVDDIEVKPCFARFHRIDGVPQTIYESDEEEEDMSGTEDSGHQVASVPRHAPPHQPLHTAHSCHAAADSNEETQRISRYRPLLTTAQSVPAATTRSLAAVRKAQWANKRPLTIAQSDSFSETSISPDSRSPAWRKPPPIGVDRHAHPTVTRRASMFVRRMSMAIPTLSADPVPQSSSFESSYLLPEAYVFIRR